MKIICGYPVLSGVSGPMQFDREIVERKEVIVERKEVMVQKCNLKFFTLTYKAFFWKVDTFKVDTFRAKMKLP